jgi:hypothetical protein
LINRVPFGLFIWFAWDFAIALELAWRKLALKLAWHYAGFLVFLAVFDNQLKLGHVLWFGQRLMDCIGYLLSFELTLCFVAGFAFFTFIVVLSISINFFLIKDKLYMSLCDRWEYAFTVVFVYKLSL